MNVENWNWAVWAYMVLWSIGVILRSYRAKDAEDLVANAVAAAILISLLYFGGFFA